QRVLGIAIVLLGLGLPLDAVLTVGRETAVVLLGTLVAGAVAALVDTAAARAREAGSAAREAELLALFAGAVLRGADVPALLEKVRETYAQRG
ncbi:hypothetical protein, partial [Nocardia puris]|uniref:hypothetical protein n=1 Tax=Nocardia puris TaxID=208602 RepID=UPI001E498F81